MVYPKDIFKYKYQTNGKNEISQKFSDKPRSKIDDNLGISLAKKRTFRKQFTSGGNEKFGHSTYDEYQKTHPNKSANTFIYDAKTLRFQRSYHPTASTANVSSRILTSQQLPTSIARWSRGRGRIQCLEEPRSPLESQTNPGSRFTVNNPRSPGLHYARMPGLRMYQNNALRLPYSANLIQPEGMVNTKIREVLNNEHMVQSVPLVPMDPVNTPLLHNNVPIDPRSMPLLAESMPSYVRHSNIANPIQYTAQNTASTYTTLTPRYMGPTGIPSPHFSSWAVRDLCANPNLPRALHVPTPTINENSLFASTPLQVEALETSTRVHSSQTASTHLPCSRSRNNHICCTIASSMYATKDGIASIPRMDARIPSSIVSEAKLSAVAPTYSKGRCYIPTPIHSARRLKSPRQIYTGALQRSSLKPTSGNRVPCSPTHTRLYSAYGMYRRSNQPQINEHGQQIQQYETDESRVRIAATNRKSYVEERLKSTPFDDRRPGVSVERAPSEYRSLNLAVDLAKRCNAYAENSEHRVHIQQRHPALGERLESAEPLERELENNIHLTCDTNRRTEADETLDISNEERMGSLKGSYIGGKKREEFCRHNSEGVDGNSSSANINYTKMPNGVIVIDDDEESKDKIESGTLKQYLDINNLEILEMNEKDLVQNIDEKENVIEIEKDKEHLLRNMIEHEDHEIIYIEDDAEEEVDENVKNVEIEIEDNQLATRESYSVFKLVFLCAKFTL